MADQSAVPDDDRSTLRSRLVTELGKAVLRAERAAGRPLDRAALARRLNVSPASLYAYLNGTTLLRGPLFDELLAVLGVGGAEAGRLATLRDQVELAGRRRRAEGRAGQARPAPLERPRQLPASTRHFVGRTAEIDALDGMLDGPRSRVPTVVITAFDGTAGVGKTALALHWAHQVADRFPDGQLHVDLQGFDDRTPLDPDQVLHGFLHALGVAPAALPADPDGRSALYRSLLAERRVLVVLDNARSAAQVRPLLPAGPGCLAIVTSRARLTSLVVREGAVPLTLPLLSAADAAVLLAHHLGSAPVAAEPERAAELVELCAHLPLALSVVGARRTDSLGALVDGLRDTRSRLDMLEGGAPDVSLRTVFAWSYVALPPKAARLFRLLSIHPGPDADIPTCAALAGTPSPPHDLLRTLGDAHLLAQTRPGRFGYHDLLRAYAAELATHDTRLERVSALERLLDFYLAAAARANALIQPSSTPQDPPPTPGLPLPELAGYEAAMSWFTAEIGVIGVLLERAVEQDMPSRAWRLARVCAVFLRRSGRRADRVAVHRVAVDAALRAGDRPAYATALRMLADALARTGRASESIGLLDTSRAEFEALGDADGVRQAHLSLARVHQSMSRFTTALDHAERALRLARGDDGLATADGLTSVARQKSLLGDHTGSLVLATAAVDRYRVLDHPEGEADALMIVGGVERELGGYERAVAAYERALEIDRRLGDRFWAAQALLRLADVREALGEAALVREYRREASDILHALHLPETGTGTVPGPGTPASAARRR